MKNKIISSSCNPETGTSKVVIQNKYGQFSGFAFCHPDDMDNFSQYAGDRYAEHRASAKFAKFRYKQEKIKLKTIQNLLKDIEYSLTEEEKANNPAIRKIKLKLRDYSQSVEDWDNLYHFLNESVNKQVEEREKVLARANKDK